MGPLVRRSDINWENSKVTTDNFWRDRTFGKSGRWIWIHAVSLVVLPGLYTFAMMNNNGHPAPIANTVTGAILLLFPTLFIVFYISQVISVFQNISLNNERLVGGLYFGRHKEIKFVDLTEISYYPLTRKVRLVNLFDTKNPGIDLITRDDEIYKINYKTENFSALVQSLRTMAKRYPQIKCSI